MIGKVLRERGERLRAYVEQAKGVSADWDGCSTFPAQWVADETGAEFDMPVYRSEAEGRALLEREGGLVAIWDRIARQAGLRPIYGEMPSVGDVGIIETGRGHVGGIFTHAGGICVRTRYGVTVIGVVGRSFPRRQPDGTWCQVPVVVKAWALDA